MEVLSFPFHVNINIIKLLKCYNWITVFYCSVDVTQLVLLG